MSQRIDRLQDLIEKTLKGEKLVLNFELDPSLTKERTLTLYKWILCSHLYLHYNTLQEYLKTHEYITNEELAELLNKSESLKSKRRLVFKREYNCKIETSY